MFNSFISAWRNIKKNTRFDNKGEMEANAMLFLVIIILIAIVVSGTVLSTSSITSPLKKALIESGFLMNLIKIILYILGTAILIFIALKLWHHYVVEGFISGIKWVVLEVKVPREMNKTPLAMELFLANAMYQMSTKGVYERWWMGAVKFYFSLEIASIEGKIHFFIRMPSRTKKLVETQLYAQYPQVEVKEVLDYTMKIPPLSPKGEWNIWGCEFKLAKTDVYPIKTYLSYGLDKQGEEEEEKVDPLTSTLEMLGSLSKGEQAWIQIVIQPTEKHYHTHGTIFGHHGFKEESVEEIKRIFQKYATRKDEHGHNVIDFGRAPAIEQDNVKLIRDNTNKLAFDAGIRLIYLGKKESFDNNNRRALRLMFRQYASQNLNSFERIHSTQIEAPWEGTSRTITILKNRMLDHYRERMFFHPPLRYSLSWIWPLSLILPPFHKPEIFVLNTEGLATIYHFPGLVSQAPTFERIESKTAKPPWNLPT